MSTWHLPLIFPCQAAVNERKKSMKLKEILRKKNEKLNDLEEEAKERAQYLLERAADLRLEQEDEIKTLNKVGKGSRECSL